ncbi:MAG: NAD(P)/FAD-dependent oxidoreductase, partial [Lactobacillus sp.]|nr:NAD(P)/FAD-dependent oxidoreductase [Lactobacillus sp.]
MHLLAKLERTSNKILVIEKGLWGGTCPNTGCQPKIFMEGAVRPVLNSYYLTGKGIDAPAKIAWPTLVARKKKIWAAYHQTERGNMTSENTDTVQGKGVITGPHTVRVGDQEYKGKNIVIGTGLSPRDLDILGSEYAITNNEFFDLDQLPKRAIVIGGGYVALELATILQAAGSEVTILQHSDRLLRLFDQEMVGTLQQIMEDRGINFYLNAPVEKITKDEDQYTVITTNDKKFASDLVINAAGRKPNVEGIGLEEVGVEFDPNKGVKVNEHMQTTIPSIFAAGDVADNGQPNLTPVAWVDAYYIVNFVENGIKTPITYSPVATNAFTYPEIAQVGIRETEMEDGDYVRT